MEIFINKCSCIICHKEYSIKGIHSHFIINHTEEGRIRNLQSILNARSFSKPSISKAKDSRESEYYKNPNKCKQCNRPLEYEIKRHTFCNSSCAAKFNNVHFPKRTKNIKIKPYNIKKLFNNISKKLYINLKPVGKHCKVFLIKCKTCSTLKYVKSKFKYQKTCGSKDCKIHASVYNRRYHNGSKRFFECYNPNINSIVRLESSWELKTAEHLNSLNLNWIRPSFIKWVDNDLKTRRYFPDFYLPDYNLYIDPKNPYCMKLDEHKMKVVSSNYNIIYGNINYILDYLSKLGLARQ